MSQDSRFIWLLLLLLMPGSSAAAGVPGTLSYQGRLTDDSGRPLNAATDITFAIYDVPTGGSALWQELHTAVIVTKGLFNVSLGTIDPVANPLGPVVFTESERWLGVTVGSGPEATPRQPLTSAPFAMRAAVADTVAFEGITGPMIAPGTITFDKLAAVCSEGQILVMTASGWSCGVYWSQARPVAKGAD